MTPEEIEKNRARRRNENMTLEKIEKRRERDIKNHQKRKANRLADITEYVKGLYVKSKHGNKEEFGDMVTTLLEEQDGMCPDTYIQWDLSDPKTRPSLDRIVPGSKGGKYEEGNVKLKLAAWNSFRSDTDGSLLLKMCAGYLMSNGFVVQRQCDVPSIEY